MGGSIGNLLMYVKAIFSRELCLLRIEILYEPAKRLTGVRASYDKCMRDAVEKRALRLWV